MSTFDSQTTGGTASSSSSAYRFGLDEHDTKDILVYKMRFGYNISSQERLCKELDNPHTQQRWRCSRKPIPRGISRIDVKTRDLFTEHERVLYQKYPNQDNSLASCEIPRNVYWRRMFFGDFKELFIVSPDSSPASSTAASNQSSNSSPIERTQSPTQI